MKKQEREGKRNLMLLLLLLDNISEDGPVNDGGLIII